MVEPLKYERNQGSVTEGASPPSQEGREEGDFKKGPLDTLGRGRFVITHKKITFMEEGALRTRRGKVGVGSRYNPIEKGKRLFIWHGGKEALVPDGKKKGD